MLKMIDDILDKENKLKKRQKIDIGLRNMDLPRIQYTQVKLNENPIVHQDYIMGALSESTALNPVQIMNLIGNNVDTVIDSITKIEDMNYFYLMKRPNFLTAIEKIASKQQGKFVYPQTALRLNSLLYNLLVDQENYPEKKEVQDKVLSISAIINKDAINAILGINMRKGSNYVISQKHGNYMALCRYSSIDEKHCINRLNFFMAQLNGSINIFNEQVLIYVYETLFNSLRELFIETITDVIDENNFGVVSDEMSEAMSLQMNAILTILNSQSYERIYKVLFNYNGAIALRSAYKDIKVRCSMRSLSEDYANIKFMVSRLENEGIWLL